MTIVYTFNSFTKNLTDQGILDTFHDLDIQIEKVGKGRKRIWRLLPTYEKGSDYQGFVGRCSFLDCQCTSWEYCDLCLETMTKGIL